MSSPKPIPKPIFSEGQNVCYTTTSKVGTINKVVVGSRSCYYKVTIDGEVRVIPERFLEPYIDVEENILSSFAKCNFGMHSDYGLFQIWFRLARPLENNLYSYLGSKTIFNPHQFNPLLRFLSSGSDERLFIADEVGVGKTIETGIILNEMMARDRLTHHSPILIVCPNALGPKWVKEMEERFGLHFHLHDGRSLKYTLKNVLNEGKFPKKYMFSVVALQLIRRQEHLSALREIDSKRDDSLFSMVIVDEAHHMRNSDTDSNELGNILSGLSDMMLMLSATPLNLRNEDLYNQMHILNPLVFSDNATFEALQKPVIILNKIRMLISKNTSEAKEDMLTHLKELQSEVIGEVIISHPAVKKFISRLGVESPFSTDEIINYEKLFVKLSPLYTSFTRTRKREAFEHQVHREAVEVPIKLSEEEMKFHDDVLYTIRQHYLARGGDSAALPFVTNTHRRMISSCIPAIREYLEWCVNENQVLIDESKSSEDVEDDSQLETKELETALKEQFIKLIEEAKSIEGKDTKYEQFRKILDKILADPKIPQVMVFSFFVRTLKYLKHRLEKDGYNIGIIHGKVPLQQKGKELGRYEIMDLFQKGKYQILLSSEVGGEGLDFQYCRAIINYDLPYNPMRIEQRIGRIDRFGQMANKIIISNLFIKDTVDEEIYDRLYRRINLVEEGVGILEPILGKKLLDIQNAIITGELTEEQKENLSKRVEKAVNLAKAEMEEFEKRRRELLSDDYLTGPINSLTKGNFVSPDDALQLTQRYVSEQEGCKFNTTEKKCGEIVLSGSVISKIEKFLKRPGNEGGYNELDPLLSPKKETDTVFDGTLAQSLPNHVFLPPTGYWTRFLVHQLQIEGKILKTFQFGTTHSEIGLPEDKYLAFLFELRTEGIKTEIEFIGIPVNIQSHSVKQLDFEHFPRNLANAKSFNTQAPSELDVNALLDSARNHLDKILDKKREELNQENRYRIESRIAALKKSSEMKIKKLQQQKEKHIQKRIQEGKEPDKNFLRLTDARVEKEKSRLELKIRDLEEHRELSINYSLEAVVYLEVRGN